MGKVSEHELLMFLSGQADKREMLAIQDWVSESDMNAIELGELKEVYDCVESLSNHVQVDENAEWGDFLKMTATKKSENSVIHEIDILAQLDGSADYNQKRRIQDWRSTSSDNEASYHIISTIYTESNKLKEFKDVNADAEWALFSQQLSTSKKTPEAKTVSIVSNNNEYTSASSITSAASIAGADYSHEASKSETRVVPLWYRYAAAASLAAVFALAWYLWPRNNFETIYANEDFKEFRLKDGSDVVLNPNAKLTFPKKFKGERRVYLEGNGTFDITSDPSKPFIVEENVTSLGIRVLGTKFRFEDSDKYVDVIENIEGSIRAYSLKDTNVFVMMTKGDKYGFDGVKFERISDIVEIDNSKEYNILYVLDYLMQSTSWKVVSGPYIKFDEKGIVKIDLEKPIEEILEDLKERADFDYSVLQDCDDCYRIDRFTMRQ